MSEPTLDELYAADLACPLPVGVDKPYIPSIPVTTSVTELEKAKAEAEAQLALADAQLKAAEATAEYDQAVERYNRIKTRVDELTEAVEDAKKIEARRGEETDRLKEKLNYYRRHNPISEGDRAMLVKQIREMREAAEVTRTYMSDIARVLGKALELDDLFRDLGWVMDLCGELERFILDNDLLGDLEGTYLEFRDAIGKAFGQIQDVYYQLTQGFDLTNPEDIERLVALLGGNPLVRDAIALLTDSLSKLQAIDAAVSQVLEAAEALTSAALTVANSACEALDGVGALYNSIGMVGAAIPHSFTLGNFVTPIISLDKLIRLPVPDKTFGVLSRWAGTYHENLDQQKSALKSKGVCGDFGVWQREWLNSGAGFLNGAGKSTQGLFKSLNPVGDSQLFLRIGGPSGGIAITGPRVEATPETAPMMGEGVQQPPTWDQAINAVIAATNQIGSAISTGLDAAAKAQEAWLAGADAIQKVGEAANAEDSERIQKELEANEALRIQADRERAARDAELEAQKQMLEAQAADVAAKELAKKKAIGEVNDYIKGSVGNFDTVRIDPETGFPVTPTGEQAMSNWVGVLQDLAGIVNSSSLMADHLAALGAVMYALGGDATPEQIRAAVEAFLLFLGDSAFVANFLASADYQNIAAAACAYYAKQKQTKLGEHDALASLEGKSPEEIQAILDAINAQRAAEGRPPVVSTREGLMGQADDAKLSPAGLPNSVMSRVLANNKNLLSEIRAELEAEGYYLGGAGSGASLKPMTELRKLTSKLPLALLPEGWHTDPAMTMAIANAMNNYAVDIDAIGLLLMMLVRNPEDLNEVTAIRGLSTTLETVSPLAAGGLRQKALYQGRHDGGMGSRFTWYAEGKARVGSREMVPDILKFVAHHIGYDVKPYYEWLRHLSAIDVDLVKPDDLTAEESALADLCYEYTSTNARLLGDAIPRMRVNADALGGPGGLETVCLALFAGIVHRAAKRVALGQDPTNDLKEAEKLLDYVTNAAPLKAVLSALLEG